MALVDLDFRIMNPNSLSFVWVCMFFTTEISFKFLNVLISKLKTNHVWTCLNHLTHWHTHTERIGYDSSQILTDSAEDCLVCASCAVQVSWVHPSFGSTAGGSFVVLLGSGFRHPSGPEAFGLVGCNQSARDGVFVCLHVFWLLCSQHEWIKFVKCFER